MLCRSAVGEDLLSITRGWRPAGGCYGGGGGSVCLPEVINLHQKSNDVKMSFEHLQLSEAVSGLFLSDAQHAASLQHPGGRAGGHRSQFICSTSKFIYTFKKCKIFFFFTPNVETNTWRSLNVWKKRNSSV